MPYFKMDWRVNEHALPEPLADVVALAPTEVPWTMGLPSDAPVPDPFEFRLDEDCGTLMPDAFLVTVPLFSDRLIALLHSAGVDNLVLYDALITDPRTGTQYRNYKAVNVIGAISCANLAESKFDPDFDPPMMKFSRLVLDEEKAKGQLLFRLAEASGHLLVHQRLAEILQKAALVGVRLVSVEELANR